MGKIWPKKKSAGRRSIIEGFVQRLERLHLEASQGLRRVHVDDEVQELLHGVRPVDDDAGVALHLRYLRPSTVRPVGSSRREEAAGLTYFSS